MVKKLIVLGFEKIALNFDKIWFRTCLKLKKSAYASQAI